MTLPLATKAAAPKSSHGSETADVPPPPPIIQLRIWPDGGTSNCFCYFFVQLHFIWEVEYNPTIKKIFDHRMGWQLQQMLDDVRQGWDHLTSWL
ncbi:hypothetical protein Ahy_B06g081577 isoform B [Arachis hypogaea]|uniref:Uncharacterized protein n=1 Tax=Arachis hypogaea TaxID=3818 RepID=A0A444YLC7_ARAHY|nr:hypothetical protein Ahy_B06g081577 isoform B [Arachis hypogaea]